MYNHIRFIDYIPWDGTVSIPQKCPTLSTRVDYNFKVISSTSYIFHHWNGRQMWAWNGEWFFFSKWIDTGLLTSRPYEYGCINDLQIFAFSQKETFKSILLQNNPQCTRYLRTHLYLEINERQPNILYRM